MFLQKFSNRASVVQPSEAKFWEQVKVEFMTEESDDPDDPTVIIEHRISWCSKRKDPLIYRYNLKSHQLKLY